MKALTLTQPLRTAACAALGSPNPPMTSRNSGAG